jgi:tetratricopeptide (TPR) repeat protein
MMTVPTIEAPALDGAQKLASWKAIADYFHCNERTAKRWELERGLPVHRAPGGKRGYVFAYTHELDEWLRTAEKRIQDPVTSREEPPPTESSRSLAVMEVPTPIDNGPVQASMPTPFHSPLATRRWLARGTAGAAMLLTIGLSLWLLNSRHAKSSATPSLVVRRVPVPDAERLYLRGRYLWNLRTTDSLSKAIDAYTQAIVKDPSYAEPYAGLAEVYELSPQFAHADLAEAFARAESAADRAIQLDPNLVAAHRAKAFVLFYWNWDIAGSDAEFKCALALDPSSAETHHWYASTLLNRHEGEESIRQIDEAVRLNPTSTAIATDAAFIHATFGDFDDGMKSLRTLAHTQPALATASDFLRTIEFAEGDYEAYIADTRQYASITGNPDELAIAESVARGWAQNGKTGMLKSLLKAQKLSFKHGAETGFRLGQTYILLGDPHTALQYFNASLSEHFIMLITMEDCNWAKNLARDSGYRQLFDEIRKRMKGRFPAHPAVVPVFENLPQ